MRVYAIYVNEKYLFYLRRWPMAKTGQNSTFSLIGLFRRLSNFFLRLFSHRHFRLKNITFDKTNSLTILVKIVA